MICTLVTVTLCMYTVAIAAFANFVPEIVELVGNRPKYAGTYKVISIHLHS